MKRVLLFILLSVAFACGLRAQMVNNIPNYLYSGSLGVGRSTANDANVYLQIGPNGAGTKGMIIPWVADTAAISGTKRNFLFIRSSQLGSFAYWDSTAARWYKIGFTDTTVISTKAYAQKVVDDSSKVLRALASAADGVTSVATNTGTGITGGTITSTGTIAADTTVLSTKAWAEKAVDDTAAVLRTVINAIPWSTAWGSITGTLSAQTDLQSALDAKQATLVSATNIKTINSNSLLGSGDLVIGGGSISALTAATATNTIDNAAYQQEWKWDAATGDALKLTSTSTARTGGTNSSLLTLSSSGANANASANIRGLYVNIANTGTTNQNYGGQFYASGAATVNVGVFGDGATYGVSGQSTTGYAINGLATSGGGRGVQGTVTATTGTNYGVRGDATGSGATNNYGGYFNASGATTNYGVWGEGASRGVYGVASGNSGYGVYGRSTANFGNGVYGENTSTTGSGQGVYASATGAKSTGYGIYTTATGATTNYALYSAAGINYFNGLVRQANVSKTSSYTATVTDHTILCDATSGAITITLPASSGVYSGAIFIIKKTDASGNAVTIDADGSETIDGATTYVLSAQYKYVTIQSNGTSWFIIGNN